METYISIRNIPRSIYRWNGVITLPLATTSGTTESWKDAAEEKEGTVEGVRTVKGYAEATTLYWPGEDVLV